MHFVFQVKVFICRFILEFFYSLLLKGVYQSNILNMHFVFTCLSIYVCLKKLVEDFGYQDYPFVESWADLSLVD